MNLKNSTLRNKLRNYSVLSGSLLAAGAANGQIIYHGVKPAVILSTDSAKYSLDLNADGDTDFVFQEIMNTYVIKAGLSFQNKSESIVGSVYKYNGLKYGFPYALNNGEKISKSANWFNYAAIKHVPYLNPILAGYYIGGSFQYGKWVAGKTDKYVGFKFKVITTDTATYYGWARCTVTLNGTSLAISGYAYQSIPDSSINAGDTDVIPTGIKNQSLENLHVYSFGKNVVVKYTGAARDGMTIIVRDILGREIQAKQTNDEMYEFYLPNEASGIYTVSVRSRQGEMTKKVSIQ